MTPEIDVFNIFEVKTETSTMIISGSAEVFDNTSPGNVPVQQTQRQEGI